MATDKLDIKQLQKVPVKHYPHNVPDKPLLSVCVMTYQHVNFIKQCLDGILMQKTNFDFEILLGEDDSTDGTREICIEYANKYPDKIKLFLHSRENNIKIGGQPTGRFNMLYNLNEAKGKYIALCEGDDYWTDPLKLQKQVDFLEENEEYSIVGHKSKKLINENLVEEDYSRVNNPILIKDWIGRLPFRTNTFVFRNELNLDVIDMKKHISGDRIIMFLCLMNGKGYLVDKEMSVYREHIGGISKNITLINVKKNEIKLFKTLNLITKNKYKKVIKINIFNSYGYLIKCYKKGKDINKTTTLIKTLPYINTFTSIKIFIKEYLFNG